MLSLSIAILIPFIACVEIRDVEFEMVESLDGNSGLVYTGANYSGFIDCSLEATSKKAKPEERSPKLRPAQSIFQPIRST